MIPMWPEEVEAGRNAPTDAFRGFGECYPLISSAQSGYFKESTVSKER